MTLYEVAISMVLACGGGIVIGAVIGSVASLRILLLPLISTLYAVPLVIIYPLFVVWLGLGPPSKIAFASLIGFFPAALSTAAGIQTIDPQLLLAARSMGATTWQRLTRVLVPAAIPTVLSGLRLGGALTIVGVVVSEMLVASQGIGYLISFYRQSLDSPHIYAGILLVLLLAVGFDAIVQFLEKKSAVWRQASHREAEAPRRGQDRGLWHLSAQFGTHDIAARDHRAQLGVGDVARQVLHAAIGRHDQAFRPDMAERLRAAAAATISGVSTVWSFRSSTPYITCLSGSRSSIAGSSRGCAASIEICVARQALSGARKW